MKKILLFLVLFIFSTKTSAQLDREHWFAPMMDRSGQTNPYQSIYMSTNEATPFKVDIYSNNVIIGSVMISKNNPGKFSLTDSSPSSTVQRSKIITRLQADLFRPLDKGIYLQSSKPFFASLRFSVNQHAEIITSKGTSGMGTEFYATPAPIDAYLNNVGFMTSIMAKEDGTVVTIDNFDPSVVFSDGVMRSSFVINLNKGQSYIIDGTIYNGGTNMTSNPNKSGFIGAKISSNANHPITVTNGNFNGQYVQTTESSTDILMDQSVPVDKLGTEFILVKGNGTIHLPGTADYSQNMEKAFIVATVNGTNIYVNNEPAPVNPTPLNAGQYYVIPSEKYVDHSGTHRNMYIKSTQNIYVFQLLAGASTGNEIATGGYNYIPPLSCYLPREIDEIASVSENEGYIGGVYNPNGTPTKLNIITEKGAVVTVEKNGIPFQLIPTDGPYDVVGNNGWVTYSIARTHGSANDVSGNIKVKSTKAVTAGISAGDGAVGYGGYFAGFSYIPTFGEVSGCFPDAVLTLSQGYDNYKWMFRDKNGNISVVKDVNGAVPDANILKPTQVGYYWAVVQQGSCGPVTIPEMQVFECVSYTPVTYDLCDSLPPTSVKFTLSNQGVKSIEKLSDPANPANPSKGQFVIDNVAKTISYIPSSGATGEDFFRYKMTGDNPSSPATEEVRVKVNINTIFANDTIIKGCKIDNVKGQFDLNNINKDASLTKVFYKFQADADGDTGLNTIPNSDLANYQSPEGFVYLRLKNISCKKTIKIELKFYPKAKLSSTDYIGCDLDFKGVAVDFDQVKAKLLLDSAYFPNVNFYLSGVKLNNGWTYSADTVVQMEVISPDGCAPEKFNITFKVGAKLPLITNNATDKFCDPELNDSHTINLNNYKHLFLNPADMSIQPKFYNSLLDAQEDRNTLESGDVNLVGLGSKTFYYRFEDGMRCPNVGTLTLEYIRGFASTTLPTSPKIICEGSTILLDAGNKHVAYEWFDENDLTKVFPKTQTQTLGAGKYYVILTSPNGCQYKQSFEIIGSPKAQLDVTKFNATICDVNIDGKVDVKFSTDVTPLILLNPHPDLTVQYYSDATMSTQLLPDNFSYQVDTRVYVKVVSKYCSEVTGFIDFRVGNKIFVTSTSQKVEECDDDLDAKFLVKDLLQKYKSLFTNDATTTVKFYVAKTDAQNNASNNVDEINVNNQQLLYVRISNATHCPELVELTIQIKLPKKSELLVDKTICLDATTFLDADSDGALGFGFTYDWFNEEEPTTSIGQGHYISDLKVGKYFVIITAPNLCPYKQNVEIKAAELPTIEGIEINGSTVKIIAKGGNKPYKYAISTNGLMSNYQDSEIFVNVLPGLHTAYVISADNCEPSEKEFSVIEIYNLISPNGDGKNDVLDMSLLKYKLNVKFQILDRSGKKLFDGNINNNFIWDGKENGKALPTSSYWYIMEWQDFENSPPVKYTGWILLKNRNSD